MERVATDTLMGKHSRVVQEFGGERAVETPRYHSALLSRSLLLDFPIRGKAQMLHIKTSTMINRPVDKVFEFVADNWFTNLHVWNHDLIEIRKTSDGPVNPGTTGTESQTIRGKPYSRSFVFEDYQPNKGFADAA